MPKLSVYIPDDLWEMAKRVSPEEGPSLLIQRGLRGLVESRSAVPAYAAERPAGAPEDLAAARTRLMKQARAQYEAGFQAGKRALNDTEAISGEALEALAHRDFNLEQWLAPSRRLFAEMAADGKEPFKGFDWLLILSKPEYLGDFASPIRPANFEPNRPYLRGFADAMREMWKLLTHPIWEKVFTDEEKDQINRGETPELLKPKGGGEAVSRKKVSGPRSR
jgi:hypothetical protein